MPSAPAGHVVGNGAARRGVRAVAHAHGRHQVRVAADERIIPDGVAVLGRAVVIDGDHAAAEIAVFAHVGIAHIGQVRNAGALAHSGILDLHKIADVHIFAHTAVRPNMCKRPMAAPLSMTLS